MKHPLHSHRLHKTVAVVLNFAATRLAPGPDRAKPTQPAVLPEWITGPDPWNNGRPFPAPREDTPRA